MGREERVTQSSSQIRNSEAASASEQTSFDPSGDLRTLMAQASVGILVVDLDGRVSAANEEAVRIFGAPNQEALLDINVFTQPKLIEKGVSAMFRYVMESGESFEIETPYRSDWGKEAYFRTTISPRFDAAGQQVGALMMLEDISDRKQVQQQLMQQLRYERSLAQAARILLQSPEDDARQRKILDEALEQLREAAEVDRAFVFRFFTDPELGECMGLIAEACAPGVYPHIANPQNQRLPVKMVLPEVISESLKQGQAIGGAVKEMWHDLPDIRDRLLAQPLMSFEWIPIFLDDQCWGFVGFDDMEHVREWREQEVMLLQTGADIIGSALQRWETLGTLRLERDMLEKRVQERTTLLERRLQLERVLATAASRLITPADFGTAIQQSLQDIGEVLGAIQVLLVRIDMEKRQILESYRWHPPDVEAWPFASGAAADWFRKQVATRKPLYITDTTASFEEGSVVREDLLLHNIEAMIMYPLEVEGEIVGIFNVSLKTPLIGPDARDIIGMLDIKANLLNGLIQRQILIEQRDRQILEQTRALSALLDAAMLGSEARGLKDVIRPILTHIEELSRSQMLAVYELKPDGQYEKIAEHGALGDDLSWASAFTPDKQLTDWLTTHNEPMLLNPDGLATMAALSQSVQQSGVGMIVDIRAWQHFDGLLLCYRSGREQYSPNQVAMTTALADYMSTIIENYLLRELAESTVIIEERSRLARDLHDSVSQSLYGVMLFARAGRDALESGDQAALAVDLTRVEENALRAMKEMRLLLFQLQPVALDQVGLAAALAQRFEQVEGRLGIETALAIDPDISLSPQLGETLYRLASEALNNALKHADASRVAVQLAREDDAIVLAISDNGRGFDPQQTAGPGMGLTNMRFRAEKMGGRLEITSSPAQGTTIRCRIPVTSED